MFQKMEKYVGQDVTCINSKGLIRVDVPGGNILHLIFGVALKRWYMIGIEYIGFAKFVDKPKHETKANVKQIVKSQ